MLFMLARNRLGGKLWVISPNTVSGQCPDSRRFARSPCYTLRAPIGSRPEFSITSFPDLYGARLLQIESYRKKERITLSPRPPTSGLACAFRRRVRVGSMPGWLSLRAGAQPSERSLRHGVPGSRLLMPRRFEHDVFVGS